HQLQHERPELCFWLPRPGHYLHHRHRMWRHNFGITVDVWDRVFGTYRSEPWRPDKPFYAYPLRDFLRISWIGRPPPRPPAPGAGPPAPGRPIIPGLAENSRKARSRPPRRNPPARASRPTAD